MIYPLVTGFHWADFDFQWYIEACRSRPGPAKTASGFHSVETFITQKVHPGTQNVSIADYVTAVTGGKIVRGVTPLQVADLIDARADAARAGLNKTRSPPRSNQPEFDATFSDVRMMTMLGKYYAAKIRGATELALFRATRKPEHQERAVKHLQAAAQEWVAYAFHASQNYGPRIWTNRVGHVDWQALSAEVAHDIEIARAPLP